jgi:phage tail sheath gpL-like
MGAISFNSIPVGILTPGSFIEFSDVQAQPGLAIWNTRAVIFGQALPGSPGGLNQATSVFGPANVTTEYGLGSMIDKMSKAWFECNTATPVDVIAVAQNPEGVFATYTITVTDPPTAPGTLALYIGGEQVLVGVAGTETDAQTATEIAAAINAIADLPLNAAAAGAVATLTCAWKGLTGSGIDIRTNYFKSDVMPTGLALTIAAGVAGAGNPSVTAALAAMGDTQYHFIVWPWTDGESLVALATELANRRGPMEQKQGSAFCAANGSLGTLADLGATMNSPDITITEASGPANTWERAARLGATIAFYGSIDPARPFQTLVLVGDIAPNPGERFTRTERQSLLMDGISTNVVDPGGLVEIERPITTYQFNADGAPDPSYLDVNTLLTLNYLRYTVGVRFKQKFPRCKLADDGTPVPPGSNIVTPKTLGAELVALAYEWQDAGLVDNVAQFQSLLVVQRNASNPSEVDALIPPNIISGLRVFAAQIDFAF